MQLKITRSQKQGGLLSSTVTFALDGRVEFTRDEAELIKRYKLGSQVIYNSQRSKEHIERGREALTETTVGGFARTVWHIAALKLSLNITIDSMQKGHHIESQSLDEMMGAEDALKEACQMIRGYLDNAASFDGREQLFDF